MTTPPGSTFSDQSVEFWRDIESFFHKRNEKLESRIFNSRFLLKTTTFIGSSRGVQALLKSEDFELGYKEYLSHVYGDVLLFAPNNRAVDLRAIFASLFHKSAFSGFQAKMRSSVAAFFLPYRNRSESVCVYSMMKRLCSELMISLFLDLDPGLDAQLVEEIILLSTKHWHGIISVPVSLKGLGFSSGYSKAADARAKLKEIVAERMKAAASSGIQDSFLRQFAGMPWATNEEASDHLVLLVTALVPKALASLLTSVILTSEHWLEDVWDATTGVDEKRLGCVTLEAARLWPPFIGGRRIASKDTQIGGYSIPAGRPVVFLSLAAHRDPDVFADPNAFRWHRWDQENANDKDKVWWFGAGARDCVGKLVMQTLLKDILTSFISSFAWERTWTAKIEYKWLPVSRPKAKPEIRLSTRAPSPHAEETPPAM